MVHPQAADGGDGLQIWRVAASILNKQSWTAGKKWWGLGMGLTTPHCKIISLLQNVTKGLKPGQIIWINDLSYRKWT
jgi:hypothetical protein